MYTTYEPGAPLTVDGIPLCIPERRGNEWLYIKECLDTNWVSSAGSFVHRFERMVAEYVGAKYAVAIVNGTAALHVALMVAGVAPGDEVLVSDLTFIAPAFAIRYVGAWPVLVDAESLYWQLDPQQLADFVERECIPKREGLFNKTTGRRVAAFLPVHILGHPVDIDPLLELARQHGLAVIEDATESLGAAYKGRPVGHLGDAACFSFNGNKLITTGGGGMLVTDNESWARKARYLTTQAKDDPVEYIHNEIGYNYRLTNIQAAMGCAQMEQLAAYIGAKRRIASTYVAAFAGTPGILPMPEADWASSTRWLYTVLVDAQQAGITSRALLLRLEQAGIQSRPLWAPLHTNPVFRDIQVLGGTVSEQLNRDALSLPCSVGASDAQLQRVIEAVCTRES